MSRTGVSNAARLPPLADVQVVEVGKDATVSRRDVAMESARRYGVWHSPFLSKAVSGGSTCASDEWHRRVWSRFSNGRLLALAIILSISRRNLHVMSQKS